MITINYRSWCIFFSLEHAFNKDEAKALKEIIIIIIIAGLFYFLMVQLNVENCKETIELLLFYIMYM